MPSPRFDACFPPPNLVLRIVACLAALGVAGCAGVQSSLAPAGREAERIALLYWWMAGGALLTWVAVIALALYSAGMHGEPRNRRRDATLIIGGGVVIPTVVLTVLLVFGLAMLPPLVARAPEGSLQIEVDGELWWWRIRYLRPGAEPIELANEIRLPVNEPVQFRLASDNVIHSFWVPSLGGKMDLIPGRVTYLALQPTKTGVFRGACAEYCGASHALMGLSVDVMEPEGFAQWLDAQAAPAREPTGAVASRGQELFFSTGCSACHTIRGTTARGRIGPDLTHVGSRLSLAAAVLPNDAAAFERWVASPEHVKPGAHMPRFDMLPPDDVRALAAYMEALE